MVLKTEKDSKRVQTRNKAALRPQKLVEKTKNSTMMSRFLTSRHSRQMDEMRGISPIFEKIYPWNDYWDVSNMSGGQ